MIAPEVDGLELDGATGTERSGSAVAWIRAFNARWQVALIPHGIADLTAVKLVEQRQRDYLDLAW